MDGSSSVRDALTLGLAGRDSRTLGDLAAALAEVASRTARADPGPPRRVTVGDEPARGAWVGYVLRPDGSGCWLALGWQPTAEAAGRRASLPLAADDHFRLGPIAAGESASGTAAAVLLAVEYRAGSLPAEHRLRNDLHSMVMLGDLLTEQVAGQR